MRKSISRKLMLALGILFAFSLAGLSAYHLVNLYQSNLAEGELSAQHQSMEFESELSKQFERTISIIETLRSTILQLRAEGIPNREYVVGLLQSVLEERPELLGVYTLWEPNAFDGRDAYYSNRNSYHDDTGRFIPYVVRNDGQIRILPIHSYEPEFMSDFYLIPQQTKQFSLIEPYWYDINDQDVLMTSLVLPIMDEDGQFMGMVGADFELDFVQQEIENIRPLGGYANMITEQRNYLASGNDRSKVMMPYDNPLPDRDTSEWLRDQTVSMYTDSGSGSVYRLFYPIEIENALWHLEIVIPKSSILQPFNQALRNSLIISIFALCLTIAIMFVLIRRIIVRNIRGVIGISAAMVGGDMQQRLDIRTGDEFETMADHFNRMIDSRKEAEAHIHYQATHDMLTQLYNRKGMYEWIQRKIDLSEPEDRAALLFIDLDRFKYINDTLNHEMGDAVLVEVAGRIRAILGEEGTVFRFGGDEFIVLLHEACDDQEVGRLTNEILRAIAMPIELQKRQYYISASIGIVIDQWSSFRDSDRKIKEADSAMYIAKKEKNTYKFFVPSMNHVPSKEIVLENDMQKALEENQFTLYYQPKVDIATFQIYGAEALIRWNHPELGMVSPLEFIPIAEKTGFINQLGEWVVETACKQNRMWQDMGLPPLTIAVNMSMIQFQHVSILEMIRQKIESAKIRPELLELELTESVFMNNPEQTMGLLNQLKELGVQISLDDFGTGYSSLSYLKNIPLDYLKLDKSFISNIETDRQEQLIVKSVIVIAHNLGLKVVTEGVETKAQYDILREHLCDGLQGYYFSPPLPSEKFLQLYRERLPLQTEDGNE